MPPNPPAWTGPPISPRQLKVVCDNMLQGLGRYLRCCGVDVHILDNEDLHDKCAVVSILWHKLYCYKKVYYHIYMEI